MKIIFLALTLLLSVPSFGQIKTANLTASGLTCSMCSKAIYKALVDLPIVDTVEVDIEKSSYLIKFKSTPDISPEDIKKSVEDAGFAIASLKLAANFSSSDFLPNNEFRIQGTLYRFIKGPKHGVNGMQSFTIVSKGFVSKKDFKKYSSLSLASPLEASGYSVIF